ncbi:MAG: phosphotriesterase-related protein [Planctomycetes bacterium]|nr:phosphotriesterase-related protein [Planctomycetota bacterium]
MATATGPVNAAELGVTLVHEHLRSRRESVAVQFPHLFDEGRDLERALLQVEAARAHGVRTLCDATVPGIGRDARFARTVAERTGVHIVVGTGFYTMNEVPPYFAIRSIDHMADAFVHDAQVGIQGTDIRAGFLKCVTGEPGLTPGVEHTLRAVARAHRRSGLPIMTHSNAREGTGLQQQDLFETEGVDLRRVLIGHSGDTDDLEYLVALLERGSFIGFDRYGLERWGQHEFLSTERRNRMVLALCGMGFAAQLMVSHDYPCYLDSIDPTTQAREHPNWSMTYLFDAVIPALRAAGVTDVQIRAMMIDNPRRWLETRTAY